MKKEVTKLRKLSTNSVDLVRRGCNQEAHIQLFKGLEEPDDLPEEVPQGLWDAIKKSIKNWWNGYVEEFDNEPDQTIEKSELGIDPVEIRKSYDDAILKSIESILTDETMDSEAKKSMAITSLNQYFDACDSLEGSEIVKSLQEPENPAPGDENIIDDKVIDPIEKNQLEANPEGPSFSNYTEEGEEMKIDKSRFTPEELEQYEALIAKGLVEDEEPEKKEIPEPKEEEKEEEEMHPEVKKALAEIEDMKKGMEMKELTEIAKKYSVLGKKEDELAQTLYDLKKSDQKAYDSYVALLNEQVDMVEKSGMFTEIGKSARGPVVAGGDTQAKIENIATDIQKAEPTMDRVQAIAKAWEQHPELVAEYEQNYR